MNVNISELLKRKDALTKAGFFVRIDHERGELFIRSRNTVTGSYALTRDAAQ